jgi:hypothetical protein
MTSEWSWSMYAPMGCITGGVVVPVLVPMPSSWLTQLWISDANEGKPLCKPCSCAMSACMSVVVPVLVLLTVPVKLPTSKDEVVLDVVVLVLEAAITVPFKVLVASACVRITALA